MVNTLHLRHQQPVGFGDISLGVRILENTERHTHMVTVYRYHFYSLLWVPFVLYDSSQQPLLKGRDPHSLMASHSSSGKSKHGELAWHSSDYLP